jgi:hypothetical protein
MILLRFRKQEMAAFSDKMTNLFRDRIRNNFISDATFAAATKSSNPLYFVFE